MSAGMLGVPKDFKAVGWIAQSGKTYMSVGMLGAPKYFKAVSGSLEVVKHICQPAHMQRRNITWPLAHTLAANYIYDSRHACSAGILHGHWLPRLQ